MSAPISVTISEPALLVRINQMYKDGMSTQALYEATRGVWVIGERREAVQYAFAVAQGIVREVYEVHSWHSAGSTPYKTRPLHDVSYKGRWEFIGEVAPAAIREKYLDCSVADYFPRGAANPIMYVNTP
jgi:hypothetical protein